MSNESDGAPEGYLIHPQARKGPGVLVLHPWWGLNADVRAFCTRLADVGFVAFAPDLFEGKTATTTDEAQVLADFYSAEETEIDGIIERAATFLLETTGEERIAVVGFSFGAYFALTFSNDQPEKVRSVVVFYGTGPVNFDRSQASYLGHFAAEDDFEPPESIEGLRKSLDIASRPSEIYTYPNTGHWFFEPSIDKAYDKAAAELAWDRTLRFLREAA